MEDPAREAARPSFREAFLYWLRLGFVNFGGPTGQIAMMHRDLVERKRWVSEERFLHALNYCMLLPGPEAQQRAIYVGWLLHRTWGGIVAGAFFVLPSVAVLLTLSWVYVTYGTVSWVAGLFYGLKAVVLAIVVHAVWRIGRKALRTPFLLVLAASAFLALAVLRAPFPLVVLGAALAGWLAHRVSPGLVKAPAPHGSAEVHEPTPPHALPDGRRALRTLAGGVALWVAPMLALLALADQAPVLLDVGAFFSKAALVTFGGAYAVLSYIGAVSVENGWLTAAQVVDGLGLAETTPGPLIMVVCFIGFLAGYHLPGALSPTLAGILGGLAATYFTFLFSFLFIFLGAPHVEKLRGQPALSAALAAVTAAVVGVILNLAVFFGSHVLWTPAGLDWFSVALGLAALAGLIFLDLGVIPVVLLGGLAGLLWRLIA